MGDAAGELADRFHLLRVPDRFLGGPSLGDLDRFRHDGDNRALFIAHRAHLEIEPAPAADRQVHMNFLAHDFAARDLLQSPCEPSRACRASRRTRAFPKTAGRSRLPAWRQCRTSDVAVGVEQGAVERHQALICVARFERWCAGAPLFLAAPPCVR